MQAMHARGMLSRYRFAHVYSSLHGAIQKAVHSPLVVQRRDGRRPVNYWDLLKTNDQEINATSVREQMREQIHFKYEKT